MGDSEQTPSFVLTVCVNGEPVGTGCLIRPELVLTCRHVVQVNDKQENGPLCPSSCVSLLPGPLATKPPAGRQLPLVKTFREAMRPPVSNTSDISSTLPEADLLLLELESPLEELASMPFLREIASERWDDYARAFDGSPIYGRFDGRTWVQARMSCGDTRSVGQRRYVWTLSVSQQQVLGGNSGGPLLFESNGSSHCIGIAARGGERADHAMFIAADCVLDFLERCDVSVDSALAEQIVFGSLDESRKALAALIRKKLEGRTAALRALATQMTIATDTTVTTVVDRLLECDPRELLRVCVDAGRELKKQPYEMLEDRRAVLSVLCHSWPARQSPKTVPDGKPIVVGPLLAAQVEAMLAAVDEYAARAARNGNSDPARFSATYRLPPGDMPEPVGAGCVPLNRNAVGIDSDAVSGRYKEVLRALALAQAGGKTVRARALSRSHLKSYDRKLYLVCRKEDEAEVTKLAAELGDVHVVVCDDVEDVDALELSIGLGELIRDCEQ